MKYKDYRRNHVVVPGRDNTLASFLSQDYKLSCRSAAISPARDDDEIRLFSPARFPILFADG